MLSTLHIRDFAVVERLELELHAGLSVLTGETGTGKSILIDALGLALGDRTDSGVVRHGCPRTEITAEFDLAALPKVQQWLHSHELDSDEECQIRRTITAQGRSKAYINGRAVTLSQLRTLGEQLLDIHGQHEHQSLLKRDSQRALLDEYAGHEHLLENVDKQYRLWHSLKQEYDTLCDISQSRDNQLDLIRFQVEELAQLEITTDELPRLEDQHRLLAHADQLAEGCQQCLQKLDDGEQPLTLLADQILNILGDLRKHDNSLDSIIEMLNSARINMEEAANELRQRVEGFDIDPASLQNIEQRLSAIHDMARKHRVPADTLPEQLITLQEKLAQLEDIENRLSTIEQEIASAAEQYQKAAAKLSKSRAKAATSLAKEVSKNMQPLGMTGSALHITLSENDHYTRFGMEQVEFLISTNPGQPAKPLAKIASGGELSRISLAIQVITAEKSGIPTLIFDEVDVGIGGRVAEIVGQKLRELGTIRQVLCVTHQPQVAALGHNHFRVSKTQSKNSTSTEITPLNKAQRSEEIARMLGGIEITKQTRAHADDMLQRSNKQHLLNADA